MPRNIAAALSGYPPLLDHILDGKHYGPMLRSPEVAQHRTEWRAFFKRLIACPPKDREIAERFHTQWHVSHHFIHELVEDDTLLMDMLWIWLPRYEGPAMVLYRGENIDRLEDGKIGAAWSDKEETARMFASGWNAEGRGGVILRTIAPVDAIIAGPSAHSADWLGESEFTVDWRKLVEVERIRTFAPHSS
jgi:hypothetical protein